MSREFYENLAISFSENLLYYLFIKLIVSCAFFNKQKLLSFALIFVISKIAITKVSRIQFQALIIYYNMILVPFFQKLRKNFFCQLIIDKKNFGLSFWNQT